MSAAPAHTDAYAIVEVSPDLIHIKGAGSVTSRQLRVCQDAREYMHRDASASC